MAREAGKGEKKSASDLVTLDVHDLAALENKVGMCKPDDVAKYRKGSIQSTIKALYYGKTFMTSTSDVPNGTQFGVLLDKTNFYAEAGGQIFSYEAYVLHTGYMMYGILKIGDTVISEYDELRRQLIRMNHTGIHILNFALREVLGGEVCQRGSLVAPEKLHFDFSHKSGLTEEDLKRVQVICHNYIKDDRVVSIGVPANALIDNTSKDWWTCSVELCGGTHVDRTGEIKDVVLLEESVIAKGVRRLAAATGQEVQEARQNAARLEEHLVSDSKEASKR
ncbi:hypothetical protein DTO012A8_9945 [Penicillium roqueforti]|nr:hypothetical protein DTO012A8_9945 [Penicillium roqueforti]